MKIHVISPRLDSLIKAGLNASRTYVRLVGFSHETPRVFTLFETGAIQSVLLMLFLSSRKSEEMFYEGRLRLNGEKVTKKSAEVSTLALCQFNRFMENSGYSEG